jgi:poly [ADP-ribose] polymerase
MASIVEKIHLIKNDPEKNNNKFWIGELYENGDVNTRWGRVGDEGQSKMYSSAGKSFLDKKVNEKKKARNGEIPYRSVDILSEGCVTSKKTVNHCDLNKIAKSQIQTKGIALDLIDFLVRENAHQIMSHTGGQIQYNFDTGLFQTPMGVLGQSSIDGARLCLDTIADLITAKSYGDNLLEKTRDYLMLVPHNIGRKKLDIREFWSSISKVQEENQLLDGLQSSLANSIKKDVSVTDEIKADPKVFETKLLDVDDKKIIRLIFDNFMSKRSSKHSSYNYKPKNLWHVEIASMKKSFEQDGLKLANNIEGFHGTPACNILSLLKTGFLVQPPKNAHISGKMFGNGTYTAPCHIDGSSTKALNYAIGYWGNGKSNRTFMFICDVGMGKYHVPSGPCSGIPKGYDSCWAKGDYKSGVLNDECIVYRESQINIKYLMELERY